MPTPAARRKSGLRRLVGRGESNTRPGSRPGARRPAAWRVLVPLVALGAGALFATSARASQGTDLRSPETVDLAGTVRGAESTVRSLDEQLVTLTGRVDAATVDAGRDDQAVAALQSQIDALAAPFGQTPLSGPGFTVTLDDAPSDAGAGISGDGQASGAVLDQLVIHQSDLQAVVNALWAGGAEAVSVAGQRLIPTSAVRCVGNTLLLNGRVYSPPYRVVAIGPSAPMRSALDASPGVSLLKQAVTYYGVRYAVSGRQTVTVPAYTGPLDLSYASPS